MRSPISKTASAHFCAYVYVPLEISSVVLEEQPPPAAKQGQSSTRSKEKKMGEKNGSAPGQNMSVPLRLSLEKKSV